MLPSVDAGCVKYRARSDVFQMLGGSGKWQRKTRVRKGIHQAAHQPFDGPMPTINTARPIGWHRAQHHIRRRFRPSVRLAQQPQRLYFSVAGYFICNLLPSVNGDHLFEQLPVVQQVHAVQLFFFFVGEFVEFVLDDVVYMLFKIQYTKRRDAHLFVHGDEIRTRGLYPRMIIRGYFVGRLFQCLAHIIKGGKKDVDFRNPASSGAR